MRKKSFANRIMAFVMAVCLFSGALPVSVFAELNQNNSSTFDREGTLLKDPQSLIVYYPTTTGGAKAYIPIDISLMQGNKSVIGHAFLDILGGTGAGSTANTAAFRFKNFSQSGSQYLAKVTEYDHITRTGQWYAPPYNIGEANNISFRYVGAVINSETVTNSGSNTVNVLLGTNPNFPSDAMQESASSGKPAFPAQVWNNNSNNFESSTAYYSGDYIYDIANMYTNGLDGTAAFTGTGNVKANNFSSFNSAVEGGKRVLAEASFNRWLNTTGTEGYAAQYKAKAEAYIAANGLGIQWWELLNRYFQINGNVNDPYQTVYFYCVAGKTEGTYYYRTYSIPGKIKNNVQPTYLSISEGSAKMIAESYRDESIMDAYNGGAMPVEGTAHLEAQKVYTVQAVLSYYVDNETFNAMGSARKTSTANTNRDIYFYWKPNTANADAHFTVPEDLHPASNLTFLGSAHAVKIDGLNGGAITANSSNRTSQEANSDTYYYYNGAAFASINFYPTTEMGSDGIIVVSTSNLYTENGDNECAADDTLEMTYTLTGPPPHRDPGNGDMNLGRLMYRRLHYIGDLEIPDNSSATGTATAPEGSSVKKTKTVKAEYVTDYGEYHDAESAKGSFTNYYAYGEGEEPYIPESDGKYIYRIDETSWWEYSDSEWPNQTEDEIYKLWIDETWEWGSQGHYVRSETESNPFTIGFRVSRNRADASQKATIDQPTLEVQVYGISPNTSDDGELIESLTDYTASDGERVMRVAAGNALGDYSSVDAFLRNVVISKAQNGIEDYPKLRIRVRISPEVHGESGIYTSEAERVPPFDNSWDKKHDEYETEAGTILAESDDMRILEVEVTDSEGIVVYHADRYTNKNAPMDEVVNGTFDKEEDLSLKIVIEQNKSAGHLVKDPAVEVRVDALNMDGNRIANYVSYEGDNAWTKEGVTMVPGEALTFEKIYFRPKNADKLDISVNIAGKHGPDNWRENEWDDVTDSFSKVMQSTTADMSLAQDIELYNSKGVLQNYLTFAEYLNFKYAIKHIGANEGQAMIVGNTALNPLASIDAAIYNADRLSQDPLTGKLLYSMVTEDPNAEQARIYPTANETVTLQTTTRLYPGLGSNGYSSHCQTWLNNYVVQSYVTDTGNVAACGNIVVTGKINVLHDNNGTNIRDNTVDFVQKQFKGEKNISILDLAVTSKNAASNEAAVSVQLAISNMASSYNDQTMIDRTWVDIYIEDEKIGSAQLDLPVGDTVITEIPLDKDTLNDKFGIWEKDDAGNKTKLKEGWLNKCRVINARVNAGEHQTTYEYVLRETDASLYPDPFIDNYASIIVCANEPNTLICPSCQLEDGVIVNPIFAEDDPPTPETPVTDTSKFTVIFKANDGTEAQMSPQEIEFRTSVKLKANALIYDGYKFKGWNTRPDGSGDAYGNEQVFTVGNKSDYPVGGRSITLYAQWEPVSYRIAFNANSGTGSMEPISAVYGQDTILPNQQFTKYGFVFIGWTLNAEGTGTIYDNGASVRNLIGTDGATVTLYAKWMKIADCIIIKPTNYAGGTIHPNQVINENPSLYSLANYASYGYIRVRIPTVMGKLAGDTEEKVYDLYIPNWNSSDFTLVKSFKSDSTDAPSEYIYRYNDVLNPLSAQGTNLRDPSRNGGRTTDLYTNFRIQNFVYITAISGDDEVIGAIVMKEGGDPDQDLIDGIVDARAFAVFDAADIP